MSEQQSQLDRPASTSTNQEVPGDRELRPDAKVRKREADADVQASGNAWAADISDERKAEREQRRQTS
jgi:hypothetical protein